MELTTAGAVARLPPSASPEAGPRGLRRCSLAVGAVVLQAAPGLGGPLAASRGWLIVASGALVVAWFVANLRGSTGALRIALLVALVGGGLNLLVMVPNGGMPVSASALEELDAGGTDVADGHLYKHRLAGEGTVLPSLGDVLPVDRLHLVVSPGDVLLLAGIVGVAASTLARRDA